MTNSGLISLAPPEAKPRDIVAILVGAPVPHILRKQGNRYILIGECYAYGVTEIQGQRTHPPNAHFS
jgi:hypothetical protein